jgi:ferredoxin
VHRVVPVGETVKNNMEVHPFESVSGLLDGAKSWGVVDCICRVQKSLVGEPCQHPIDVCMVLSQKPNAFDGSSGVRALTRDEAAQTLRRAADAGLVHCVSNHQQEIWYICNCCTCSCGILRAMAEMGIANVVARSAFVNQVDIFRCAACGECVSVCSFNALTLEEVVQVNELRCVGCGVCVPVCPQGALGLVRRVEEKLPPLNSKAWGEARKLA